MLGRRGAAQAAFTNPEIKELGEMAGADCVTLADEVALDDVSLAAMGGAPDRETARKLDILRAYADNPPSGKPRRLTVRFLVSPVELVDDGSGAVGALRIVRNRLEGSGGRVRAVPTDRHEDLDVGLVFRSVGYRGVPLPEVPFRDDWGTVPNDGGRVLDAPDGSPVPGLYVAGWIKRGPSGVIGTNKPDAAETVERILDDAAGGRLGSLGPDDPSAIEALLRSRGAAPVTFADWRAVDAAEIALGAERGRPRVKLIRPDEIDRALGR